LIYLQPFSRHVQKREAGSGQVRVAVLFKTNHRTILARLGIYHWGNLSSFSRSNKHNYIDSNRNLSGSISKQEYAPLDFFFLANEGKQ
jgi:hypothetical protein